jgi:hypothetical protein
MCSVAFPNGPDPESVNFSLTAPVTNKFTHELIVIQGQSAVNLNILLQLFLTNPL